MPTSKQPERFKTLAMANQIKTSDFFTDDFIDKLIEKLKELSSAYESEIAKIKKEAADLKKATEQVNVATASGREETMRNAKAADKLAQTYKKLEEAQHGVNNELIRAQEDLKTVNRLRRLEAKQNLAAKDSYDALSAEMSILKIRYKQLTAEQIKNGKEGQALTKRIKDINDTLKELDANVGVHTRNVGNYTDALSDLPGILGSAGRGVKGFSAQLKALMANPIVLFIGLIVGGLTALFQSFTKSERGAQLMTKATGLLNAAMNTLSKIADSVVDIITSFADNPLKGIKELGETIKEQLVNRFNGLILSIGLTGKALLALVSGDFKAAQNAAQGLSAALVQVGTGLDAAQQKEFAEALKETTKDVINQANAFIALEAAKRNNIKANRELVKQAEQLRTVEELQRAIADDNTKSFADREAAAEKSRAALEARAQKEIQIARNNLSLINQEIDLRQSAGENVEALLDNQLSAYRELAAAEREYTLAVRDNEKQRSELVQDRLERDLDILIDGFDNQKTINERLLKDERLTLSERAKIYADTANLAVDSFAKQIETIQKFTGVQVDANALIAESDAVVLNQKIRALGLSEIIEGRLLEIVRDRKTAIQDLNEAEKDLIKERNKNSELDSLSIFNYGKAAEDLAVQRVREIARKVAGQAKDALSEEKSFSILSLLGLEDENEQKAINTALDAAKKNLSDYVDAIEKAAAARVAASDRAVSAAENEYNRQVELQSQGLANTAETAQRELQIAQENQQKAIEAQRRAQRQQLILDSVSQASNLYTAVSEVYKQLPFPFNIGAAALMIGSFVAAKAKALAATRQEFAEGDLSVLEGGSHGSGRDIFIGEQKGKKQYAEGGEARMILSKRQTRKYMQNGLLPAIYQSLKSGQFEKQFVSMDKAGRDMRNSIHVVNAAGDSRKVESLLRQLVKQGEDSIVHNNGTTIRKVKNWTITTRG